MITTSVKPLSFDYQGFKYDDVKPEGDASLLYSYIQLTSTSRYQTNTYSVGRITCFEPLQLWDKTSRKLTDFTTKFSFVIYSNKTNFGDGLAFFLADPELPLPEHMLEGGGLGLVDKYQIVNSTKYSFVAVEFDTCHNPWDPSGMHVAATGVVFEMNTLMSWSFDSTLQIHDVKVSSPISTNPSPSPIPNSPKIDSKKGTIWVGLGVGVDYSFRPSARQVIQVLKFEAPLPILQHMMLETIYSPPRMNTIFGPVSSSFVAYTS
ncbi:hypothetical protein TSUD_346650 [Trifolium subterraneum]|nr:hypothetical protein TSUD_346650 [Trifolium subterraneum]